MGPHKHIVKSILGDYVYEALNKAIVKSGSQSVVDITELHDALKIAPKSVVAFLVNHLTDMKENDAKEIEMPWDKDTKMLVNKISNDVYKGHFVKEGKIIHEFDLCSIPQLAAHILSQFELYDEVPTVEDIASINIKESDDLGPIKQQLSALEAKINALIMLVTATPPPQQQDSGVAKILKSLAARSKELKKAGVANSMPKPPRPGVHSGSKQGIAQSGKHGKKTPFSDFNPRGGQSQTSLSPYLKTGDKLAAQYGMPQQPKQPKQAKMSFMLKNEMINSKCLDCGEPDFVDGKYQKCACFKVLSTPQIKKSENGNITLVFQSDWDADSRMALWRTLKKVRR